jgi:hypothetical protein
MVPTAKLPPGTVSTSQLTLVLELPVTEAEKDCVWPVVMAARRGEMVAEMVGGGV